MTSFDPIPTDFIVTQISESKSGRFYAGLTGSLWHFVWANVSVELDSDNHTHHSINQVFFPRFLFAEELQRQLDFVEMRKHKFASSSDQLDPTSEDKNEVFFSGPIWGDYGVGVTEDYQIFLVSSDAGYVYNLGDVSDLARDDLNRWHRAKTEVLSDGNNYYLAAGSTHRGNQISHSSRRLIEAIAFERHVYGQLDPVNVFDLFSAFCTLVDSSLSREFPSDYISLLIEEQESLSSANAPKWLSDLILALQDAIFDGHYLWGDDVEIISDSEMPYVVKGFEKLSNAQRCQMVLIRDLHSALPFVALALVVGMLDSSSYADLLCSGLQPDSEEEISIRSQTAVIDFLGTLAR